MYDEEEETWWQPPKLTATDLKILARLAEKRAEIAAVEPADRHEATLRRYLLAVVDRMEEALCTRGHREAAAELAEGWEELAAHDAAPAGGDGDG